MSNNQKRALFNTLGISQSNSTKSKDRNIGMEL